MTKTSMRQRGGGGAHRHMCREKAREAKVSEHSRVSMKRNGGFLIHTWHIHSLATGHASTQNAAPGAKPPTYRIQNAKGPQKK